MDKSKKQIVLVPLLSLLLIVSIGSVARAGNTVRVFLMAGQSNMEGNNTSISRLQELICHANSDFIYDGVTCGSTDIDIALLTKYFLDNEQPLNDYYYAQSVDPNHPVVIKLGDFLCAAGKLSLPGENCNTLSFDLTDRFFATISGYYYHEGNQQFQWGYDAFKEMSAAMGVSDTYADGHLTADLLAQRSDVTVLQFQGHLSPDGTLSFSERSGLLSIGFGAAVDRYGPELMFGHYMGDLLDDDVLLLKVVQGGTDLRVDWKTPCSSANANNNFTPEELAQDSLYDALIAKAEDIQDPAKLVQYFPQYAGKKVRISGFVWFQGWNDGLDPLNQANYETNLRCLLNDLRSDLGEPNLPIVIAQSHVGEPDNPVQVAQAIVASDLDNTELAITDDLSGYYHFDNAAHLVIGQRMAAKMTDLLAFGNTAPVANDQSFQMRAAELLALPFTLAATDADGDILNYTIVSGPSNGSLSGTAPRLEYVPDSTFRGLDTFTYKAADTYADSNVATVTIEVAQESCTSAQIGGGPTDSLFVHVPSHLVTADISANQHTVTLTGDTLHESASTDPDIAGHPPFVSRNDLTNKTITIDLGSASTNVPLSISFKLMPTSDTQNEIIMQSNAFVIEDDSGGMTSTYYDNGSGRTSVTNNNSTLKTRSCNHFAVVLGNSLHITYLNGYDTQQVADTSNLRNIDGVISIGPYPGKVWDIRIYNRILTPAEIMDLGGSDCSDELLTPTPYPGYPNYLFGVYIDEWWPDHATESLEEFQYYLHAQDTVYERNLFEAGMYARDELCSYFDYGGPRSLELSDGIRSGFVAGWTFSNPLKRSNCDYWMHENFHSYQGNLGGYLGFGMSKFMLESGASWGPDHMVPGKRDTLLAYYSMHPHLPLWTIQNSPVDMRAGWEFKGGHQYGAYICWSYFTKHITNKMWLGDVHSTPGHVQAAHDLLAVQGHDMADHFGDFAARITTWDMQDGAAYRAAELASLQRMINAVPECPRHDNKITTFYDEYGTGDQWTSMPTEYIPGAWAWNAYKIEGISSNGTYNVALMTDVANPANADFRAQVVVHDTQTDVRTYHILDVAAPGVASTIAVPAGINDELYLVVATTPNVFSGWDWYEYQYKIYQAPAEIDPPTPDPMTWQTVPYATGSSSIAMVATTASDPSGVEYYFTCTAGGGNDSGWQDETMYEDTGLSPSTTYTYTVTARDKSANQNETAPSTAESATTNEAPPITLDLQGYWPFDGDALDDSGNGHDGTLVNGPGYVTGKLDQAVYLYGPSDQYVTAANPISVSPPWTVSVWINKQGPPQAYNASGLLDGGTGPDWTGIRAEQYGSGDPPKVGITKYEAPDNHNHYWNYALPTGTWAHLVFVCTATGTELYVDNVSQGELTGAGDSMLVWIDWIGRTHNYGCPMDAYLDDLAVWSRALITDEIVWLYNGGAGNPVGGGPGPDTDPPTPNPATFASPPAAVSHTEITMTATTGSDATGPVEYFFDEISGNPGGTDSGWTTDPVYNDTGLNPDTQYTYTVQMRDSVTPVPNVGTASSPANATTDPAPDTDPPTPNPATFASPPAAVSDTEITMTATTGTDATGPVEYFFDEISGNPGGTDSGWTTNPVYNDTGLNPDTQYTYTVQMRDSVTPVPNVGAASSPASATTDPSSGTTTLLDDDFEGTLGNWSTDWDLVTSYYVSPSHSIECSSTDNDLVSIDLDTSSYSSITITFKYRIDDIDAKDNIMVQYYNGNSYVNIEEIGDDSEDTWLTYNHTTYDSQYLISNFRLKIEGSSIDRNENLWIDDVLITAE